MIKPLKSPCSIPWNGDFDWVLQMVLYGYWWFYFHKSWIISFSFWCWFFMLISGFAAWLVIPSRQDGLPEWWFTRFTLKAISLHSGVVSLHSGSAAMEVQPFIKRMRAITIRFGSWSSKAGIATRLWVPHKLLWHDPGVNTIVESISREKAMNQKRVSAIHSLRSLNDHGDSPGHSRVIEWIIPRILKSIPQSNPQVVKNHQPIACRKAPGY